MRTGCTACTVSDLGQVSQFGSLPAELLQHTVIEHLLLLTAVTELRQACVVQTGPVLGERLGTVPLNLPAQTRVCVGEENILYRFAFTLYFTSAQAFIAFNCFIWVWGHFKDVWWAMYAKGAVSDPGGRSQAAYRSATFITASACVRVREMEV